MWFQSLEDPGTKCKQYYCYDPEVYGPSPVIPEPYVTQHGITISGDNIVHRIQFEQFDQPRIICQHIDIPHGVSQTPTCRKILMICVRSRKNTTIALVAYTSPSVNINVQSE